SCGFNVTVTAPTTTDVRSVTGQYGGPVSLTATVSPTPLAGQAATGTVTFFVNGNLVGSSSVNTSGVAVFPYTIVQVPGTYPISANYVSTSPFFLNSAGSGQLTVVKATASVTPNASGKIYGSTDPVLMGTLTGFLAADNVTASYSRTAGETPGTYAINTVLSPANVLANYAITTNAANFTINKYSFSVCASDNQCTGGSKPNSNGVGGRLTITPATIDGGTVTATVTLSPATVNTKDALTSPDMDANN